MNIEQDDDASLDWSQIMPLLDEAMESLSESDRTAVLMRYFQDRSLREVGESLGVSEDAARKRVTRALDKLRHWFARREVACSLAALGTFLTTNAARGVETQLATSVINAASKAASTTTTGYIIAVLAAKKLTVVCALIAGAAIPLTLASLNAIGDSAPDPSRSSAPAGEPISALPRDSYPNQKIGRADPALPRRVSLLGDSSASKSLLPMGSEKSSMPTDGRIHIPETLLELIAEIPWGNFQAGKLRSEIVEALKLSPQAAKEVFDTAEIALKQYKSVESRHASVHTGTNGNQYFEVSTFPEQGAAVRRGLEDSFTEIVGPDAAQVLVSSWSWDFSGYGARTYEVFLPSRTPKNPDRIFLSIRRHQAKFVGDRWLSSEVHKDYFDRRFDTLFGFRYDSDSDSE